VHLQHRGVNRVSQWNASEATTQQSHLKSPAEDAQPVALLEARFEAISHDEAAPDGFAVYGKQLSSGTFRHRPHPALKTPFQLLGVQTALRFTTEPISPGNRVTGLFSITRASAHK